MAVVNQITLTGMVISATPVNEYDRRVVILTKERGKIVAFAKGARRPNSQYIAGTRPFSFGEFTMYEGRTAYNLVGISISNYFEEIATDINCVYYGFYFLEFAEYFAEENMEAKDMLNLLYVSLRALMNKSISNDLVKNIFELKMFALNGTYPNVYECMECGTNEQLEIFSLSRNGCICHDCKGRVKDGIEIGQSSIYAMQYIISSKLEKLYTFTVSDEVLAELGMVMNRWISKNIDKEFKSLELL